jgi:hypothetical protein
MRFLSSSFATGDIKRDLVSRSQDTRSAGQLGPAVFKQYQDVVAELMRQGTPRIVVDGLDAQYWRGQVGLSPCQALIRAVFLRDLCSQGHATLGTVDACVLLACKASDADTLVRRVVDRGREPANVAEARVRKNIPDTARSWAIVGALAEQLRGLCAEVDAMQVCGVCIRLSDLLHAA